MDKSFIDLFEDQVVKAPDNIAVVFEDEQITYKELDRRSNSLANYLQGYKNSEEMLVPLFIERGINMIVGMLGIMKAGCAYVPIETDFPQERISYMLEDTKAIVAVSSKEKSAGLPGNAGLTVIEIESVLTEQDDTFTSTVKAQQLAYIIYTSGSTGKPKGVMVEQGNLVDYVEGLINKVQLDNCKSFALVSSIVTDLGNTVIFGSLATGGALHLFSKESVNNTEYLHTYFAKHSIECLKIVPSHWKALNDDDQLLLPTKLIIFGGEALSEKVVKTIRSSGSGCQIVNHYGPTETTIGKLLCVVEPGIRYDSTIPIGKPFSKTKVLILNSALKLCPIGVPGQLYITGDGLARGYLNNEELTKQKFIPNPFIKEGTSLMYATGDLVKYLPDGNVQFLGRVDDQVKIRGYRVELGEIESVIQESDLVKQAVVLGLDDKQGNKRLVAYVVGEGAFDREELLSYLKDKLPDYMVPSVVMELESLPLAPNGKVDRKSLPDPDEAEQKSEEYTAPRNATEIQLAEIWENILEVDQVGINDDFFELGGHSLLAVRLISAIRKAFKAELPISDVFDYPTVAALAARLDLQQTAGDNATTLLPAVGSHTRPAQIPLSFSQERLWFIDQLEGSVQYHVPAVLKLRGKLNASALNKALGEIIKRHEVLRTTIYQENGQAWQKIEAITGDVMTQIDGSPYRDDPSALKSLIKELISVPFDLAKDLKLRAHLITIKEEEYILIVTLHHIASDGWSRSILVGELVELYTAYTTGRRENLPPLPVQYADYAIWQRSYLEGEVLQSKLSYWKEKLQNVSPLELPTDHLRPAVQSSRGSLVHFSINQDISGKLQTLSQEQGVTLYMTLLSAFKVLLYRYSGQEDICVGTPIAGRQQQELEGLIGFFVNTLALRSQVEGELSFTELLQAVKVTTLEAYANQEIPFEKVVEAVATERDLSRNPLFQVMFIMRNQPDIPELRLGDVELSRAGHEHTTSLFDLSFFITETPNGLQLHIEYSTDLFSTATIQKMAAYFQLLLTSIIEAPQSRVESIKMLGSAEEDVILSYSSPLSNSYPLLSIVDLFAAQVLQSGDSAAIIDGNTSLTYKELDQRSNRQARYLQSKGLEVGMLVLLFLDRGIEMMISILAILKAGGAYVPLDPSYPQERITFMLEDTRARLAICSKEHKIKLQHFTALEIIEPDGADAAAIASTLETQLQFTISPDQLAYVIYTSGSTGKPKGVLVEHKSVVSLVKEVDYVNPGPEDTLLVTGSPSFDATTFEYWSMLLNGGRLVLCSEEELLDNNRLKEQISRHGVTMMWFTSSWFNQLTDTDISLFEGLKTILVGGEQLSEEHIRKFRKHYKDIKLINGYGPTENTTFSLTHDIGELPEQETIPIGKPLSNRQAYVLSKSQELVPVGVPGEICLGGAGLSRGYLNRPELTEEKFITIADPTNKQTTTRIYRTGDLGRWLTDGTLEYLGRIDEQVKIRGYRIEPGEIESVILQSGKVKQAVVVAKPDGRGSKRLVGYVVGEEGFSKAELNQYLSQRLPEYMVPAIWMELASIPLTANGKTDKQALPEIDISQELTLGYVAPETELERKLASIWQELLGVERVGVHDDFFELGGHSLMAMRIVSYIEKDLLVTIPIKLLFQLTTVSDLSKYIEIQAATISEEKSTGTFTVLDV
jgi:amino acid adenylation domain-containing protein